jgi:hypothetical protein
MARLTGTLGNVLETLNKKCETDKLRVHSFQVDEQEKKSPVYTFLLEPAPRYLIELPTYPASPPLPEPQSRRHAQVIDEAWRSPGHCSDCWSGEDYVPWPVAEGKNHQFGPPPGGK